MISSLPTLLGAVLLRKGCYFSAIRSPRIQHLLQGERETSGPGKRAKVPHEPDPGTTGSFLQVELVDLRGRTHVHLIPPRRPADASLASLR